MRLFFTAYRRILPFALVALVLSVAIISKVPTSHCHCNKKPSEQSKECPFKKLRLISASLVLGDIEEFEPSTVEFIESHDFSVRSSTFSWIGYTSQWAQAPPSEAAV